MEVTTVSPSPASPTEGDNLCETDVTNLATHTVTLLICLCGLVGNGAVLWLLSLKSCNFYIFDVAFSDFLFLILMVCSGLVFLVEDVSCSPIMSLTYVSLLFQLSLVSYTWALFRMMLSSNAVNKYMLCNLLCRCNLTERLGWVVWRIEYWAFFALFTVVPTLSFLCPSHNQEHCRAALISMFSIILLLFVAPMVISHTINIIKVKRGSQQQQPKRRDIVIFIIVVINLLLGIFSFLQQLGYIRVPSQVVFLLTCIHSSIKPFIYFMVGKCWSPCSMKSLWLSLQRVFQEQEESTLCRNFAPRDTGV
ncbi:PREDICTED: mas-related G-protein coupled receptor member D-like [Ficedula albicollis]|uniref:mas-related G-protein coupled receptor member D-like n=1 Tax=Ficedula albicollis TaxID=59894 RepID=UPI000359A105|nr:PREDICTED: mas-related G-protein coupled receptor member D-like [Ficedula albicollis]